jgi:hypothetical protein
MTAPDMNLWEGERRCRDVSPAIFFPEEREESSNEAFALCDQCACRSVCTEYAIENNEIHGIWGGLTQAERRKIISVREIIARNHGHLPVWMNEIPTCLAGEGGTERGYRAHISTGEIPCDGCRAAHRRNQLSYQVKKAASETKRADAKSEATSKGT